MGNNNKYALDKKSPPASGGRGVNVKRLILTATFLVIGLAVLAQPSPPSDPQGNPVPVGSFAALLLLAGVVFLFKGRNKKG